MSETRDLVIWLQPVQGEPFTVGSSDFEGLDDALDKIGTALQEGQSMRFSGGPMTGHDGRVRVTPTLVNFAHIVAVRVWTGDVGVGEAGQYL
jgi:hypothetical protein